ELRRAVCLVPQLPALLEGTVEENIRFAAGLAGLEPDVPKLLDLAGLDASFAERASSKLSVGEQQRAMLARALSLEPRVLLLDEPTSALDEGARGAVEATLLDLRERVKISTVLVTHDLAQARRMAEWMVRLDEGRVVGQGVGLPLDRGGGLLAVCGVAARRPRARPRGSGPAGASLDSGGLRVRPTELLEGARPHPRRRRRFAGGSPPPGALRDRGSAR